MYQRSHNVVEELLTFGVSLRVEGADDKGQLPVEDG